MDEEITEKDKQFIQYVWDNPQEGYDMIYDSLSSKYGQKSRNFFNFVMDCRQKGLLEYGLLKRINGGYD